MATSAASATASSKPYFDVIVLGAGLSGIDAAWHLKKHCPGTSFAVLERRENIGGTWDFFKYPGIRSDSDMQTFGFHFKPWNSPKPIAPAKDIMSYLQETVKEFGIDKHIVYNTHVVDAAWTSGDARWNLTTETGAQYSCGFLFGCTGYYSYGKPHRPHWEGEESFAGRIVHPQEWSADDDAFYVDKRIAMIGSGATAITMLPNLVKGGAAHCTMVQRTPTYIVANPEVDSMAATAHKYLPEATAHQLLRWKNIARGTAVYAFCKRFPEYMKKHLLKQTQLQLKGSPMAADEVARHFTPPYNPWDQRICLSPGGDFFQCLRTGKASMTTGHIDRFTESGILMKDGSTVDADLIISATGLTMQPNFPMSTMRVTVDGKPYVAATHLVYKGIMLSNVPNFAFTIGYTNASWTLKADLTCSFICRLLNHMRRKGIAVCCPVPGDDVGVDGNFMGLSSGYVQRARKGMPSQGTRAPWRLDQNYFKDKWTLDWGRLDDGAMRFSSPPSLIPDAPAPSGGLRARSLFTHTALVVGICLLAARPRP